MAEYKAMIMRKHELPVSQYVIYLGYDPLSMRSKLMPSEVIDGFKLLDIRSFSFDQLITSDIPEEVILAFLTQMPEQPIGDNIRIIVQRLKMVSQTETQFKKNLRQLEVIAKLRKLDTVVSKTIQTAMPLLIDLSTDRYFAKGG